MLWRSSQRRYLYFVLGRESGWRGRLYRLLLYLPEFGNGKRDYRFGLSEYHDSNADSAGSNN